MANCKNYQNEIETLSDFSNQNSLSAEIWRHFETCATCKTFNAERESLRNMVQKLERVSAPNDFEFRLRAKLNQRRNVSAQSFSFLTWRKIAIFAPATFAVLLFAFFGLKGFERQTEQATIETSNNQQIIAQVSPISNGQKLIESTETNPKTVANDFDKTEIAASNSVTQKQKTVVLNVAEIRVNQNIARVAPNKTSVKNVKRETQKSVTIDEGKPMSRDLAVERAAPSIMPRGFQNPMETQNVKTDLRGLLSTFGIETKDGFRVSDVKENSLAMRSGLLKNDVIQTVNGETASENIALPNQIKSIVLNVLRDGKTQQVKIAGDDKK